MPYTKVHSPWVDYPDNSTPLFAADLDHIEQGIADATSTAEAATAAAAAANAGTATNAAGLAAHLSDTSDAHDASAVSIADSGGYFTGTEVEAALQELGALGGGASAVTALPGSPTNGQEIVFMDSLTAPTYAWRLRYISAKSSNKWQFIGGSPGYAAVATAQTANSTSYTALATAGPSFTVPVAGDFIVDFGSQMTNSTNGAVNTHSFSVAGSTASSDADGIVFRMQDTNESGGEARSVLKSGLSAGNALASVYKVSTGTGTFSGRWMKVTPVAVGG